ncbi:uncharacterized protein EV420DRAFT_1482083 [Desarmillaria tabescens]|uniref:DUF6570 domain-containing protein n=1 Tax=Armillaria tabescens TaxID=1929756 RepID=A0AA39MZL3_ARMTA|nr:uncharacterized protein EV420DRAFT_1482083 [Desarmillaria tabescens]KAK0452776.1 hypothetical protein EV420DRAFT_1482083 [Desarmillaria tabescens]
MSKSDTTKVLKAKVQEHFREDVGTHNRTRVKWMDEYLLSIDMLVDRMSHRACRYSPRMSEDNTWIYHHFEKRACAAKRLEQHATELDEFNNKVENIWNVWPQIMSSDVKEKILHEFMEETGSEALRCRTCAVKCKEVPKFSLANKLFIGEIPPELSDLTIIEESMIALCRSKCYIFQLKADDLDIESADLQKGVKGHVIVYPQ